MITNLIKEFFRILLDLIYPKRGICILCGKDKTQDKKSICEDCKNDLEYNDGLCCQKCGRPLNHYYGLDLCYDCICKAPIFDKGVAPLKYEGYTRECIHKYKYKDQAYLYEFFAELIVAKLIEEYIQFDIVIPVPLSRKRFSKRGYNQAELLAIYIAKVMKSNVKNNVLIRVKDTIRQSQLSKKQRFANMKGVFKVNDKELLTDKTVLLVDDIYTTGATTNECAKQLLLAGAKSVYVAVIAAGSCE